MRASPRSQVSKAWAFTRVQQLAVSPVVCWDHSVPNSWVAGALRGSKRSELAAQENQTSAITLVLMAVNLNTSISKPFFIQVMRRK
ncbi:hypothetical protein UVI_02033970 [Ustilaginoidea virens]|uniref:Uncharacterized protein n=1 Tax=Ustilaginoidea virens TaxID=1159556 RepID=A0A1B5KTP2_USTVR|nr:hypothetical protein UVI_02033970 [Ustilaginoidea virens]